MTAPVPVTCSAVSRLKYPDADADRMRTLRRYRVRHEGAPDRASASHLRRNCLARLHRHLFASARLPPPDVATVARSH